MGVHETVLRRVPARAFVAATLALATLWALDRWVVRVDVLTTFHGARAASPLYAFWNPIVRPEALVFALAAVAYVVLAPSVADPERTRRGAFVATLVAAASVLPLVLFLVRQDLGELGAPFRVYANEEFWDDARKIPLMRDASGHVGVAVFLRHYVEAMPRLSLHGQHFPPGHALVLFAMSSVVGDALPAIALGVLAIAAFGAFAAFLAVRELLDEHGARQAALAVVALPPFVDFACTSMDVAFLAWASIALWASLRALRSDARASRAIVAGVALAWAALSSFAVLPLGLAIVVHAVVLGARRERAWNRLARQLVVVAIAFAASLALVWLLTGFAWWDCLAHARESGLALMTRVLHGPPSSRWFELSFGNVAAYAIASGVGLAALLLARVRPFTVLESRTRDAWTLAALATLLGMALGGLFFMETERIWLFTLPWTAAIALAPGALSSTSLRVVLAIACAQTLAFEALFFTLW